MTFESRETEFSDSLGASAIAAHGYECRYSFTIFFLMDCF